MKNPNPTQNICIRINDYLSDLVDAAQSIYQDRFPAMRVTRAMVFRDAAEQTLRKIVKGE